MTEQLLYKDQVLDRLANKANVAQFVSFSPNLKQRFVRIYGFEVDHKFRSIDDAIEKLLEASPEHSVNVRSFLPDQPQSHEFVYGITDLQTVIAHTKRLAKKGLYTIVNETVAVEDGGVSGVLQNGMVEFAPGVVPRFVEKSVEPIATFKKGFATDLLAKIYGFTPEIDYPENVRVEFSIHPKRRGWKKQTTILWEMEEINDTPITPFFAWPTGFSKLIGDKAYGLLIADTLGYSVPRTTVFSRNPKIGVFHFGSPTGGDILWMRTCPNMQEPGKYTTIRGWHDPYLVMDTDDPNKVALASCLGQQEVPAKFSGALLATDEGPLIEGVKGFGDSFMMGTAKPTKLPDSIKKDLHSLYDSLVKDIGPVRLEWVHDGMQPWILQLHTGMTSSSGRTIVPGDFSKSIVFDVDLGLEKLREMISSIDDETSIVVQGNIGMSSHIADVLRKSGIPSRLS